MFFQKWGWWVRRVDARRRGLAGQSPANVSGDSGAGQRLGRPHPCGHKGSAAASHVCNLAAMDPRTEPWVCRSLFAMALFGRWQAETGLSCGVASVRRRRWRWGGARRGAAPPASERGLLALQHTRTAPALAVAF
jgi:hypothetical protein